ncbi:MAG: hypothetical protein CM1200mP29_14480 [Verrucomicrobiota bacterium]|nr:MAG: hypothetical protein CM1200mP29_14480 [Verrucomicrobiota bacterium]
MREPAIFWGPGNVKPGFWGRRWAARLMCCRLCQSGWSQGAGRPRIEARLERCASQGGEKSAEGGVLLRRRAVKGGTFRQLKAQFRGENGINPKPLAKPELYHLGEDPSEKYDLAAQTPRGLLSAWAQTGRKTSSQCQVGARPTRPADREITEWFSRSFEMPRGLFRCEHTGCFCQWQV